MLQRRTAADLRHAAPSIRRKGEAIVDIAEPTVETPVPEREQGQTMAEYAVALSVISVAVVAAFTALSGGITQAVNNVVGFLP
jgi:Flp pilus assembly pilin Flp